jgi:hypothetical protein
MHSLGFIIFQVLLSGCFFFFLSFFQLATFSYPYDLIEKDDLFSEKISNGNTFLLNLGVLRKEMKDFLRNMKSEKSSLP